MSIVIPASFVTPPAPVGLPISDWFAAGADVAPEAQTTYEEDRDRTIERAAELGCDIILPNPNEVFVDIDSEEAFELFKKRVKGFATNATITVKPSKSGLPKRHITISYSDRTFNDWERLAIQSVLGSDPMREWISAKRLFNNTPGIPSCFFEKKQEPESRKIDLE